MPYQRFFKRTKIARSTKPIKKKKAYDELYLWPIFSQYIRLRDTDRNGTGRCFTCGRIVHWQGADCGHGIPRQHKATKYNEKNNHFQCKKCNGFEGGRRESYKEEMDKRYGKGTWNLMELASRQVCKHSKFEYDLMIADYSERVAKIKLERGIHD